MKRVCVFFLLALVFTQCNYNDAQPVCSTPATVRDLTGLDGCGWVFELENGMRLEPLRLIRCGTPSIAREQSDDPLLNFEFQDGKKVLISYNETQSPSICMVGPVVKITCITEPATISLE